MVGKQSLLRKQQELDWLTGVGNSGIILAAVPFFIILCIE